jgi:two-component system, OmpR family, sensor kinase
VTVSLRARLLVSVLALVSGALVIAAVATYAEERSYLYGRLDQKAIAAAAPISYALGLDARLLARPRISTDEHVGVGHAVRSPGGRGLTGFVPTGTFGELVNQRGRVLRGPIMASYGEPLPRPALPTHFSVAAPGSTPNLITVGSRPHSNVRYRVAALGLESGAGTVIVAVPLRDVDQTLDRLVLDEVLVVASIIVLLVGIGWLVIRVALRPLDRMASTASEISDGDLSRRVRPATSRTEIGRLGLSLNRMLVRIEDAFADKARSEERRRQFLADASHELRTPLASIRGYAELFRLGAARDPEALERAMDRIEAEATRMGILVDELLLLARLDELPEAPRMPVDLSEIAAQTLADARAMAPERAIELHGGEHSINVLGDAGALGQVLANLTVNAIIHTPEGTPIELAVARSRRDAVITVRDHGPGLPPGAEERVFARFWRADGGRTRGRGGTGLGLSIVREIVSAHHGSVRAENAPDGGALFTVTLPSAPGPAGLPRPVPEREGARAPVAG